MSEQSLTLTYTAPQGLTASAAALRLEQQPVDDGSLRLQDLAAMLSLAASGISARTYQSRSCTAWLEDGLLKVSLGLYVWPTDLTLEYELHGDLVEPAAQTPVELEREFDLVVGMTDRVALPFLSRQAKLSWQTPCYNDLGEVVPQPAMRIEVDQLRLDAPVFGVLRFHGLALGHFHELLFAVPKTTTQKVTDIKPAITARWLVGEEQQHQRLELELPACAQALLEACADGELINQEPEPIVGDELGYVVYYNTCTGNVYQVLREPTGRQVIVGYSGLSKVPIINQPFGW